MTDATTRARGAAARPSIESAIRTVATEAAGMNALADALEGGLGDAFVRAAGLIGAASGRVIVTGIGKSGHIGRKIAATLASTGTPASFVHAGEASHGDLGMITAADVILALSWSGETPELKDLIEYSRRFDVALIALTGAAESALGHAADVTLVLPAAPEACPHGLTPTTSTTMQLALGDALAMALLEARGLSAEKFARNFKDFHPGGRLGARLAFVRDVMHTGDEIPLTGPDTAMGEALMVMTEKSLGCVGIVDASGNLVGIITDGDLRRHMHPELLARTTAEVMTRAPKSVPPDILASQALEVLEASAITSLFVLEDGKPVGIIHLHDLLRAGVA